MGSPLEPREHVLSGGYVLDPAQFPKRDAVSVVVGAAGAAQNATTIPVAALSGAIPNSTTLKFGTNKFATLTAPAAAGATTLTVSAIPTALVSGDTATYAPNPEVFVAGGTLIGRTYTERDAGTAFGPAAYDGSNNLTDNEVFLTLYTVWDALKNPEVAVYTPRNGGIVYENYLPASSKLANPLATIRSLYITKPGRP